MTEEELAAIEERARFFEGVPRAVAGERVSSFWIDRRGLKPKPLNSALTITQEDVPALVAEVRRLQESERSLLASTGVPA